MYFYWSGLDWIRRLCFLGPLTMPDKVWTSEVEKQFQDIRDSHLMHDIDPEEVPPSDWADIDFLISAVVGLHKEARRLAAENKAQAEVIRWMNERLLEYEQGGDRG